MLRIAATVMAIFLLAAQKPLLSKSPANFQGAKTQTQPQNNEAGQNERGTEQTPLVVKIVTPAQNEAKTTKEAKERKQQAITENNLADYTWDLVEATAALAAIALMQAALFVWQLLYMRQGMKDASANATATLEMAKLARDEFEASHRPRLEVRFVRAIGDDVEMTVINTGETDAIFVAGRAMLISYSEATILPTPHDLGEEYAFALRHKFPPSGADRCLINLRDSEMFPAGFGGTRHLFGWIIYEPNIQNPARRTSFFGLRQEPVTRQFVPIPETDWNFIQ